MGSISGGRRSARLARALIDAPDEDERHLGNWCRSQHRGSSRDIGVVYRVTVRRLIVSGVVILHPVAADAPDCSPASSQRTYASVM